MLGVRFERLYNKRANSTNTVFEYCVLSVNARTLCYSQISSVDNLVCVCVCFKLRPIRSYASKETAGIHTHIFDVLVAHDA